MSNEDPEDSNIIDFIRIKMLQMYEDYSAQGEFDHADAIWDALSAYTSGSCNIIFKRGVPYITAPQPDDNTEES